jgi:hypothetical protein
MKKLLSRLTARRAADRAQVELDEAHGQVCDNACRSAAHVDGVRTAVYSARL